MRFAIEDDKRQEVELVYASDVHDLIVPAGAKVYAEVDAGKWQRVFRAEVKDVRK